MAIHENDHQYSATIPARDRNETTDEHKSQGSTDIAGYVFFRINAVSQREQMEGAMRYSIVILTLVCNTLLGACTSSGLTVLAAAATAVEVVGVINDVSEILPEKMPPIDAGPDQVVTAGDMVTLRGRLDASIDPLESVVSWNQVVKQNQLNSLRVAIDSSKIGTASFVAPSVERSTTLKFRLRAEVNNGAMHEDSITVVVNPAIALPTFSEYPDCCL